MAEDDLLWRNLCLRLWRAKLTLPHLPLILYSNSTPNKNQAHSTANGTNNANANPNPNATKNNGHGGQKGEPLLSVKADYSNCAQNMSPKELKSVLERRNASTVGLYEKAEFIKKVKDTLPGLSLKLGIRSKWKASFSAEYLDAKRQIITTEELCNYSWEIVFRHRNYEGANLRGRFSKDYMWDSELGPHPWQFFGENMVQIGNFPPLTMKRKTNWGWSLGNDYVSLEARIPC